MRRPRLRLWLQLVLALAVLGSGRAWAWRVETNNTVNKDFGDFANGVVVDGDQNALVATAIATQFTVLKLAAADGGEIWRAHIGGSGNARAVAVDSAKDVVGAGPVSQRFGVAKFAKDTGQQLWLSFATNSIFDKGAAAAVAVDPSDDVIAVGDEDDPAHPKKDLFVGKFRGSDGMLLWSKTIHGSIADFDGFSERAETVAVDPASGDVVVGGTLREGTGVTDHFDFTVIRFDTNGNELWRKEIVGQGSLSLDTARAVAVTGNGDVVATGETTTPTNANALIVVRLKKSDGSELWRYTKSSESSVGRVLTLDASGNPVAAGAIGATAGPFVVKVDQATGDSLWEYAARDQVSPVKEGAVFGIARDGNGNVAIAVTGSAKRKPFFTVRRIDATDGKEIAAHDVSGKGAGAFGIAADGDMGVVAAGGKDFNVFVLKLAPPTAGKALTLKDKATDDTKRALTVQAADADVVAGSPGGLADPTVAGATLHVHNPGSAESQDIALPAGNWVGSGKPPGAKGYKYADKKLVAGPCKSAVIKKGVWQVSCKGSQIAFTLDEATQGSIGATLTVGTESSCVLFGGTVKKDVGTGGAGAGVFQSKSAPAPPLCP